MATSGALSTSNQYVKYKITVTQNSQNVTANTSNVTVSVRFYRTNTGYTTYGSGTVFLKINGTTYTESVTASQKITSSGIVLISKTLNISHSADGSKTLNTSAWISLDTPLSSNEQSYNQALTTIPRATAPTVNVSSANMGTSIAISMNRASSKFMHTLRYTFGAQTGTIGSGLGASTSWTIPLTLANIVPNSTEGILSIYCDTYNGSTKIGTKSVNITATIPSTIKPSISGVTVTEGVSGLASKFGAFIKNQSKLNISISASGSYSSSVVSCISRVCGKTYNGTTFTIDAVNLCETVSIQTTVTDSRRRTATYTKEITVLEYSPPAINRLTATRCNQDGMANDEGEYFNISYAFNITALSNKNDGSYTLAYKLENESDYINIASGNSYSEDLNRIPAITFSGDNAYNIKLTISDYFKTVTYEIEVPTAFTLYDCNASGKGFAFGKVSEKTYGLEIALPIYDGAGLSITNGVAIYSSPAIDPNTSLEELILTDHTNAPESGFFYVRTMFYGSKNASSNRSQVAIPYNSSGGIWYRYYYDESWSAWTSGVKDSGWIDLSVSSGWSYQYDSDKPQYRKLGNVVYLRGLLNATTSADSVISTLPNGYRPLGYFVRFPCSLNQTEIANVQVNANGVINDHQKGDKSRTFLCLSGISFPTS